jgi:hypothetical protein
VAKTVKMQGTFEVLDASGHQESKKTTRDETSVEEASAHFPWKIAGSEVDQEITFGGVALAKRIFIRCDQEITLKLENQTDTGFKFGPGDGWFTSYSGITGMWVTTGANETLFEATICGD